jgi:cbb3-type cytochrome oxidase subunit 3
VQNAFSIFLLVVGVVVIAGVVFWYLKTGDRDRHDEDAARAFFEERGHWPDQTPDDAAEERRRVEAAMAAGAAAVSRPADDGSV